MKKKKYLNKVILGDCNEHLENIPKNSVHLFLSDIPYGINLDEWDVFHNNTNSAFLGQSPAQKGKNAFKRRGKPINGWNKADKKMGEDYEKWVYDWAKKVFPLMKNGAPLLVFGARRTLHRAINGFEKAGFLLRDVLAWKKKSAHHRAQRASIVLDRRGLKKEAKEWEGWRLGNLAPIYEPIAWFFKPYNITITDMLLENEIGAMNLKDCQIKGSNPTNLIDLDYQKITKKMHEAQKPLEVIEFLIKLTTKEGHIILDPFMGSGTAAIAAIKLKRNFIGFEINKEYWEKSQERIKIFNAEAKLF